MLTKQCVEYILNVLAQFNGKIKQGDLHLSYPRPKTDKCKVQPEVHVKAKRRIYPSRLTKQCVKYLLNVLAQFAGVPRVSCYWSTVPIYFVP